MFLSLKTFNIQSFSILFLKWGTNESLNNNQRTWRTIWITSKAENTYGTRQVPPVAPIGSVAVQHV